MRYAVCVNGKIDCSFTDLYTAQEVYEYCKSKDGRKDLLYNYGKVESIALHKWPLIMSITDFEESLK